MYLIYSYICSVNAVFIVKILMIYDNGRRYTIQRYHNIIGDDPLFHALFIVLVDISLMASHGNLAHWVQ